ncbi:MAG: hypothetical protein U1F48_11735 [Burkholderiales bacterium]
MLLRCIAVAGLAGLAVLALVRPAVAAEPRTVCTITINSDNEREAFRRHSKGDYRIVELVERNNPDWLAAACRRGIRCDSLIISGHFDGGTEFYSDRLDAREYLPVDDLVRESCSASCPGLFSQLKDVYLFGCNTLNAEPLRTATGEIERSLARAGYAPDDVQRTIAHLNARYGQSNRDRLRHVFKDVPVLYGFSSKAPLGRSAGPLLDRWFAATSAQEVGTGRASPALLSLFAPASMVAVPGLAGSDPQATFRDDVCALADTRPGVARKLAFVHAMLARPPAEARLFLDHLERFAAGLTPAERAAPDAAAELAAIAHDDPARERYLALARDADDPAIVLRMMALARTLGWLTPDEERAEFVQMLARRVDRDVVGQPDVDLACARGERLDAVPASLHGQGRTGVAQAAVRACLGSADDHAAVLRALASVREDDVAIAKVYLRHRKFADSGELNRTVASVVRMPPSAAQAMALDALAPQRLSDPDVLAGLAQLFPRARTLAEQRAIAGVLIRADYDALARNELAQSLRRHRLRSPEGEDVIDALLRRLAM